MDKDLDFEKLVEQARFLSQLMNGVNNAGEANNEEAHAEGNLSGAGAGYAGALSPADGGVPGPESADNQEIIDKAIQAVKLFQTISQNGQTSDNSPAYDNMSVHNDSAERGMSAEDTPEGEGARKEGSYTDFSRMYDETFSTPAIKAMKSAVRYVDPRYHKTLGLWIKYLEMQNMMQIYAKRAEDDSSRPEYADWRRGLLLSVRPYVGQEKQCTIDLLIKVIELKEIITIMGEMGGAS